jgi:hypothetical protein
MNADQIKILEDLLLEEQSEFKHTLNILLPRRERSTQRKQDRIDALKAAVSVLKTAIEIRKISEIVFGRD